MPLDTVSHREYVRAVTMRHMDVASIVVYTADGVLMPVEHFYKTTGKTLVIELKEDK